MTAEQIDSVVDAMERCISDTLRCVGCAMTGKIFCRRELLKAALVCIKEMWKGGDMTSKREITYECCANCKHWHKIQRWDYSKGGCDHTSLEGFACTGLAYEDGVVIQMVGLNEGTGMCECWEEAENG